MKAASVVFTIIGWVANIAIAATYGSWLLWLIAVVGIIVGISAMASKEKSVALGVMLIIFVNLFSGIFYLCWHPED